MKNIENFENIDSANDITEGFDAYALPKQLLGSLEYLNFKTPTPIQAKVIPSALEGRDILGSAPTGTGKTGAFGIPIVSQLIVGYDEVALVVVPTRELAVQVHAALEQFLGKSKDRVKTALLIGGEPIFKQLKRLKRNPRLIVGTPGRINDHLIRKSVDLSNTRFLVLDEADRMLDMGFAPQINAILEYVPEERQTFLFSATMPKNIVTMANNYLNDPVRVSFEEKTIPLDQLEQEIVCLTQEEKYPELTSQLDKREGSIIVFVKTKISADRLTNQLRKEGHKASALHGDLPHKKRERVICGFREEEYRVLVATDIAARGLDIPHVRHVISYDIPQDEKDYIHRIGRTARAGAKGSALCFVGKGRTEKMAWNAIHALMYPKGDQPLPFKLEHGSPRSSSNSRSGGNRRRSFGGKPFSGERQSSSPFGGERQSRSPFGGERQGRSSFGSGGRRFGGGESGSSGGSGGRNRRGAGGFAGKKY